MPKVSGFKPYGDGVQELKNEILFLHFEEYEAMRICDYLKLNQEEGAEMMGVSRPTFTRIYMSAREKVAKALVEGLTIKIEGGKVIFDSDWTLCSFCGAEYTRESHLSQNNGKLSKCPLCGHINDKNNN